MKRETEDGYKRTNREMAKEPARGSGFCFGCDCCRLFEGNKCGVCGSRFGYKKDKKVVVRE